MWGPPAPGTILQLIAEQVISRIGGRAEMIPYRGAPAMLSDFLAGRLLFVCDNPAVHMEYLRDGSTRALAILAAQRSTLLPDVPSLPELGLSGIDGTSWWGLFAPARTDLAAVAGMARIARGLVSKPDAASRLAAIGMEPALAGPEQFQATLTDEMSRWRPAVAEMQRRMQ
jgi:tripartite-type tricarboxylate transporter receptor subunit TctC